MLNINVKVNLALVHSCVGSDSAVTTCSFDTVCEIGEQELVWGWLVGFSSVPDSCLTLLKLLRLLVLHLAALSSLEKLVKRCSPGSGALSQRWAMAQVNALGVEPHVLLYWRLCISIPFSLRFCFLCSVGCKNLHVTSSRTSSIFH